MGKKMRITFHLFFLYQKCLPITVGIEVTEFYYHLLSSFFFFFLFNIHQNFLLNINKNDFFLLFFTFFWRLFSWSLSLSLSLKKKRKENVAKNEKALNSGQMWLYLSDTLIIDEEEKEKV